MRKYFYSAYFSTPEELAIYLIDGKCICKECAKKMKGRCPICGDYKGWCKHKEKKENVL